MDATKQKESKGDVPCVDELSFFVAIGAGFVAVVAVVAGPLVSSGEGNNGAVKS